MMLTRSLILLLTAVVGFSSGQAKQIDWQNSLSKAVALAAQQKKPVLIAFNMDRERANDRMANDHYKDPAVIAISQKFVCVIASKFRHAEDFDSVCPRFGSTTCTGHIKCEIEARKQYLKTVNVDSPQHLILKPDGTLFRKKVWFMSKEQLVDLLSQAHRDLFPEQYLKPGAEKPAPAIGGKKVAEKPKKEEASDEEEASEEEEPETTKDIKAAILKKRDIWKIKELARKLMKKQDQEKKEAETALEDLLNNKEYQTEVTCGLILAQGFRGNKLGVKKITGFLRHEEKQIRNHTAVALEDIAEPSAYNEIKKQLRREKERLVIKNLVRALGATGAKKKGAVEAIIAYTRHESSTVERNAIISLGYFKRSGKAEKELLSIAFKLGFGGGRGGSRFNFGSSLQRTGAALYSLGELESKKARKELKKRIERERIDRVAEFYEDVIDRIDGKTDPASPEYKQKRQELAADKIRRDNDPEFKEQGDRGRGDRGRTADDGDEEKEASGRQGGRRNRSGGQPL